MLHRRSLMVSRLILSRSRRMVWLFSAPNAPGCHVYIPVACPGTQSNVVRISSAIRHLDQTTYVGRTDRCRNHRPCEARNNLVGELYLVTCADVASHCPFRRALVSV